MLKSIFFNEFFDLNSIHSELSNSSKTFNRLFDQNDSDQNVKQIFDDLKSKYYLLMMNLPFDILQDDAFTLSSIKKNDKKSDLFTFIINIYKSLIQVFLKNCNVSKHDQKKKKKIKYIYIFNRSKEKPFHFDHVLILFCIHKSMIKFDDFDIIKHEFISMMNGGTTNMNRIIKKTDFNLIRKISAFDLRVILKCYFIYFFKNNKSILTTFFGDKFSLDDNEDKDEEIFFKSFLNKIFFFKNIYKCIKKVIYHFKLQVSYKISLDKFDNLNNYDFCNILLPNISLIFFDTINKIEQYIVDSSGCDLQSLSKHYLEDKQNQSKELEISKLLNSTIDLKDRHLKNYNLIAKKSVNSSKKVECDDKKSANDLLMILNQYSDYIKKQIKSLVEEIFNVDLNVLNGFVDQFIMKLYDYLCRNVNLKKSYISNIIHEKRCILKNLFNQEEYNNRLLLNQISQHSKKLNNIKQYHLYRLTLFRNISSLFNCRKDLLCSQILLLENATSIYLKSKSNALNNVFLVGEDYSAKKSLIDLLKLILIDKTIFNDNNIETKYIDENDIICINSEKSLIKIISERKKRTTVRKKVSLLETRSDDIISLTRIMKYGNDGLNLTDTNIEKNSILSYNLCESNCFITVNPNITNQFIWMQIPSFGLINNLNSLNTILGNSIDNNITNNQNAKKQFVHDQQFMQIIFYEISKLIDITSIKTINQSGVNFVIHHIVSCLYEDSQHFGCMTINGDKIMNIINLAKCHVIKRKTQKYYCSLLQNDVFDYNLDSLYNHVLKKNNFYIKLQDLIISLGQLSRFIGIFKPGEIHILAALRKFFVEYNLNQNQNIFYNHIIFPNEDDEDQSLYKISRKKLNYICFPKDIQLIAKICVQKLNEIYEKEKDDYISPLNQETCEEYIKYLFFNDYSSKYETDFINDEKHHILIDGEGEGLIMNTSDMNNNIIKKPCFFLTKKHLYIHIIYLTRLFDPCFQNYPYSKNLPFKWNPVVTEDYLLKSYLEKFINFKHQQYQKKLIYKIKNSDYNNQQIDVFEYIESYHMINPRPFLIKKNFYQNHISSDLNDYSKRLINDHIGVDIPLTMKIDKFSKLLINNSFEEVLNSYNHNNHQNEMKLSSSLQIRQRKKQRR